MMSNATNKGNKYKQLRIFHLNDQLTLLVLLSSLNLTTSTSKKCLHSICYSITKSCGNVFAMRFSLTNSSLCCCAKTPKPNSYFSTPIHLPIGIYYFP